MAITILAKKSKVIFFIVIFVLVMIMYSFMGGTFSTIEGYTKGKRLYQDDCELRYFYSENHEGDGWARDWDCPNGMNLDQYVDYKEANKAANKANKANKANERKVKREAKRGSNNPQRQVNK